MRPGVINRLRPGVINQFILDLINDFTPSGPEPTPVPTERVEKRIVTLADRDYNDGWSAGYDRANEQASLVVEHLTAKVHAYRPAIDLLAEMAHEYHHSGLIRNHVDSTQNDEWIVGPIKTCKDPLCVDALRIIATADAATN